MSRYKKDHTFSILFSQWPVIALALVLARSPALTRDATSQDRARTRSRNLALVAAAARRRSWPRSWPLRVTRRDAAALEATAARAVRAGTNAAIKLKERTAHGP